MIATVDNVDSVLNRVTENSNICTVTKQDGIGYKVMKTTFTPSNFLFVGLTKPEGETFEEGETLGVSFRVGHKKCLFNGSVTQVDDDSLRITRPETIHSLQRRYFQRAPACHTIATYLNVGSQCVHCIVNDISVGGVLLVSEEPKAADIQVGDQAQVSIVFNRRHSLDALDGLIRGVEKRMDDKYYIGVQFVGFEISAENVRKMDQLANKVRAIGRNYYSRSYYAR